MTAWITIKAPKTLYVPIAANEFDNTGLRVEPYDNIQIIPKTTRITINGTEHRLMRSIDHLIDPQGNIILSKPKRPTSLSNQGAGWAVGRTDEARKKAATTWDVEATALWDGDETALPEIKTAKNEILHTTTTGIPELDSLLQQTQNSPGWPLQSISVLQGPPDCTDPILKVSKTHYADNITAALGRIHIIGPNPNPPLITIKLGPEPDDKLKLILAEELPVLDNILKQHNVAILIITPDWDEHSTPALLRYIPKINIRVTPSENDTIIATTRQQATSFPKPK